MSSRFSPLLIGLFALSSLNLGAVTVVDTNSGSSFGAGGTGGRSGVQANGVLELSTWTQTRGYTNVTITAALSTSDTTYKNVIAYLTTKVGPGTVAGDVVVAAAVTVPLDNGGLPAPTTLFTGLILPPGTYHLLIFGDTAPASLVQSWYFYDNSTPILDTGVSLSTDQFADGPRGTGGVAAFVPASTVVSAGGHNIFTVTGDLVQAPQITKSFGAGAIPLGTTTTLTFTVTNNNPATALNGVSFSDTLPGGLTLATPSGLSGTCGGGTISAVDGAGSVGLSGATLAGNNACTFSVNVFGLTSGIKNNSVQVTSLNAGAGNTGTAQLNVIAPPNISKSFGVSTLNVGDSTLLTFTLTNTSAITPLAGVGFNDAFPAGLEVANPSGFSSTCGGAPTAVAGATSVSLSGVTLAASGQCTYKVNVKGTSLGAKLNSVQAFSTNGGTSLISQATVTVAAPPQTTKTFSKAHISIGGSAVLNISVVNPNAATMTAVSFSDNMPSGLIVATPNGLATGGCGAGVVTVTPTSISVSGASIVFGTPCLVSVNVNGTTDGLKVNTTSPVTAANAPQGAAGTASIAVTRPPVLTKSFGSVAIPAGASTTLTFTITNPGSLLLTGIAFTDSLPAGLQISNPTGLTGLCANFVTAAAGGTTIGFAGLDLNPQSSCSFSISVIPQATGLFVNTTSQITATNSDPGDPATASLNVGPQFQVRYAANLNLADSVVNFTNTGDNTLAAGSICANIYVFSPDEQMVSCCSCLITPNGLASVSAKVDLLSNTLTAAVPASIVVKLLASQPVGGLCNPANPTVATLATGLAAWGTSTHVLPTPTVAETPFTISTLSSGELSRLSAFCGFIQSNGSGFGICKSCRSGPLGGAKQ